MKQNQDPYGRGGWAQVASEEEQRAQKEETIPDLGLPAKREKIQPVREQLVSSDFYRDNYFNQSNHLRYKRMRTEEWSLFSFDLYMSDPYRWLKQRRKSWRSRRKHYLQGNWQLTGVKCNLTIQSCQWTFPCLKVWPSSFAWPGWKGGKSCCCYTGAFWDCYVWAQSESSFNENLLWVSFLAAQDQLPKEEKPEFQRKGRRRLIN